MKKRKYGLLPVMLIVILGASMFSGCLRSDPVDYEITEGISEDDDKISNMLICWNNEIFNFEKDSLYSTGLLENIKALSWIAPRGGAGIEADGFQIEASSNHFILISENMIPGEELEEDLLLIRINRTQVVEESPMPYKDILVYRENGDLYLAWQLSEDSGDWYLFRFPEYGDWFEKEVAIFMRNTTGL